MFSEIFAKWATEWAMLDGADDSSAASEPAVRVLDGPSPGVLLLPPTTALDGAAGRALQRVAADILASAPPFVLVDLSAVDIVTADGVAALVVVAETAGEADIGLAVVVRDRVRNALAENDLHDLFEQYETVDEASEAMCGLGRRSGGPTWAPHGSNL